MKYMVCAFRAKIGTMLELGEGQILAGVVYPAEATELFIVYLDPLEQMGLPEEPDEPEAETEPGTDVKVDESDGD